MDLILVGIGLILVALGMIIFLLKWIADNIFHIHMVLDESSIIRTRGGKQK